MPMRRPAPAIEPVSRMPSRRSALPGPIATSGSSTILRRAPMVRLPAFMRPCQHGRPATPRGSAATPGAGPAPAPPPRSLARSGGERDRRAVDQQPALAGVDPHGVAVADPPLEDHPGERILQAALDRALQRARAVDRIVARIGEPALGRIGDVERDLALLEQGLE